MTATRQHNTTLSLWPILLPFIVQVLHSLLFSSWLVDDAGISFAYARNLVHGHGFVAQAGVEPVEGFSNPLWTLLVAPIFFFPPVDPALPIKALSLALLLGTFWAIYRINRHLFSARWWVQSATLFSLAFLSLNTSFVIWTTSGLENPLYAMLCALAILFSIQYAAHDQDATESRGLTRLAFLAGLAAAGLALTRPDGILFLAAFPAMLIIRTADRRSKWRQKVRELAVYGLAAIAPVAAYTVFRLSYFGSLYPNTYHAKGGPQAHDIVRLLFLTKEYVIKTYDLFYGIFSWRAGPVLVFLLLAAAHSLLRNRRQSRCIWLLPFLVCSWAAYALLPTDWMNEYRFATPFFICFAISIFRLIAEILKTLSIATRTRRAAFLILATLLLTHTALVYVPRSIHFSHNPTCPFSLIVNSQALRFNDYANALGIAEATFLASDLGATLYFSEHRVHDLGGLCDPQIARLINRDDRTALHNHIFTLRPTFIHLHGYWSVRTLLEHDSRFRKLYTPIWEEPCVYGDENGFPGLHNGDYVLKSALPSDAALEGLWQRMDDLKKRRDSGGQPRPFPRE